jgi:hypothetical protein
MRAVLFLSIAGGLVLGCNPADQQQVENETKSAVETTTKKVSEAWNSLNDKARHLGTDSSRDDLESMKKQLESMEGQASNEGQKQAEAVKDQWNRLDLAEKVKDLEADVNQKKDDFTQKAKEYQANAKQTVDQANQAQTEASKSLDEVNRAYKAAQAKLQEAQLAYDSATKRADSAWRSLTGP